MCDKSFCVLAAQNRIADALRSGFLQLDEDMMKG